MPIVYATLADMQARFRPEQLIQLSDWDGTGALDQARIGQAIATAGTIIDGYVSAKYGDRSHLPVPALLTKLACDIAFFELHRGTPTEGVEKKNKAAIDMLRDIAAGKVRIDEGDVTAVPARPGAIHIAGRKRFTRDQLDGAM